MADEKGGASSERGTCRSTFPSTLSTGDSKTTPSYRFSEETSHFHENMKVRLEREDHAEYERRERKQSKSEMDGQSNSSESKGGSQATSAATNNLRTPDERQTAGKVRP